MSFIAKHKFNIIAYFALAYLAFGIYTLSVVERTNGGALIFSTLISFAGYFTIVGLCQQLQKSFLQILFISGVLLRVLFFFNEPKLSDDYLRYAWDGKLVEIGIDPYAATPDSLLNYVSNFTTELRAFEQELRPESFPHGMNSYRYFSVYPPVAQGIFYIANASSTNLKSVVFVFRLIYMLFEVGIFFLLLNLLRKRSINAMYSLIYWLNPLVIAEFTGNLHLEGVALFFTLLTFMNLDKNKLVRAGLSLSLAIATKLNPAFLLAVGFRHFTFKRLFLLGTISVIGFLILLVPLTDLEGLINVLKSVKLYSYWFEFNAGIYYFLLDVHHTFPWYNIIGMYNFSLPFFLILGFFLINRKFKNWNLVERFFVAYLFFLLISRVVHPWYLIPLIGLTPLIKWRFTIVWSLLAMFSYLAYDNGLSIYKNAFLILEYGIVYILIIIEFIVLPELKSSSRTGSGTRI